MNVTNPHDKIFKEIESIKENASDLLQAILPVKVIKKLDFSSLDLENQSYIDESLRTYFKDLVYNCKLQKGAGELVIAFLLEHKSYRVDYPHIQLLRYILNIWQENITIKSLPYL